MGGASSEEEAKALRLSLCETLAKGGFRLCKFRSSNQSVLSSIEPHHREKLPIKGLTESNALPYPKALGLEWDSVTDCMSTALNLTQTVTPTKCGLISDIAGTFDVLGWIALSVVLMKILYQKLWLEKVDWDEAVPPDLQAEHALWKQQLHTLNSRQVPRCYYRTDATPITIELHGFSDASERAYSVVVYARSTYVEHPPLVTLVSAKTKVAPLKTLSIPRLELCGADLLSKLLNNIRHTLDLPVECLTAWSDSTIVLSWLDGSPKRYRTFVGNRIAAVLKLVPSQCWLHVPTELNPADCASRGLMPIELASFDLWWDCPSYLNVDPVAIPAQPQPSPNSAPEQCSPTVCNLVRQTPSLLLSGRFSNYHFTLKVTAWCRRFVNNLKAHLSQSDPILTSHNNLKAHLSQSDPIITSHLNPAELQAAECLLFKQSQSCCFEHEVEQLQTSHPISSKYHCLHSSALTGSSR